MTNEDGYFKEFINTIKNAEVESQTKIFYLLKGKQVSCLHALETTETWNWLDGKEVSLFIFRNEKHEKIILNENNPSFTIEKGTFFGAKIDNPVTNDFGLVTCTCKPGFALEHYKNPSPEDLDFLTKSHPGSHQIIKELTPNIISKNIMQSIIQFFSCYSKNRLQNIEQTPFIPSQTNN